MDEAAKTTTAGDDGVSLGVVPRSVAGGVLMGLANLVPGISGGTMLLATGVYPRFIRAVSDVTRLKFRFSSLLVLGCIVMSAGLAILLLAGVVRDLVVDHRWIMYSLFIGLTLGGVPLVWKMARPATTSVWVGAAIAFAIMVVLGLSGGGVGSDESTMFMLFIAGVAGASAMILPGVSGGYLLILLGQYVVILSTIDRVKDGLKAGDISAIMGEMGVVIPVGVGVVAGVVGISNLVRWTLDRYEKATLGFLLGLLVGSVVGLWPFRVAVEPQVGDVIKGQVVTAETAGTIEKEDWLTVSETPTPMQMAGSVGLILVGFGATVLIARVGNADSSVKGDDASDASDD